MTDPRIDELYDRIAVQDVITELFLATDSKAWDRVKAVFAADVHFDMTSLAGGQPARMAPDAIAEAWAEGLAPVAAVHHQIGNLVLELDGDSSTASCYGVATHYKPDEEKRVTYFVGSYDLHLTRHLGAWKIDSFRFNKKYVE